MKIPLKTQTNSWFELERRHGRLERIAKGLSDGRFESYKLSEEIKSDLRRASQDIEKAEELGLISQENSEEAIAIIEGALDDRAISSSEEERLIGVHEAVLEEQEDIVEGSIDSFRSVEEMFGEDFRGGAIAEEISDKIRERQSKSNEDKLIDLIVDQERGKYIVQLFQMLWSQWGEEFHQTAVHQLVEKLEAEGLLETEGGMGTGLGKRRVYPSLRREEIRELRDGTENRIVGEIENEVTDYFQVVGGRFDLSIQEFYYGNGSRERLYLVSKERLPRERQLASIGLFFYGDLYNTMLDRFNYKLKDEYTELVDEDSQLAYVVRNQSTDETIYVDDEVSRARQLA